jgi:hypothetical protein
MVLPCDHAILFYCMAISISTGHVLKALEWGGCVCMEWLSRHYSSSNILLTPLNFYSFADSLKTASHKNGRTMEVMPKSVSYFPLAGTKALKRGFFCVVFFERRGLFAKDVMGR